MAHSDASLRGISLPDWGDESALLDYQERYFNYYNLYRCRTLEKKAMNLHYLYGRQWIELDSTQLLSGSRGFFFRDLTTPNETLPRPVTNYIATSVAVEMAALTKRRLVPNILTTSRDPRVEAAARAAKDILLYRLEKLRWTEVMEAAALIAIATGTTIMKSYWDETDSDTTLVASPEAVGCPNCDTKLASPSINPELASEVEFRHKDTIQDIEGEPTLTNCPTCEAPTPLQPFMMGENIAQERDYFGRPMGLQLPRGNTNLELISPFDFWPENMGVDADIGDIRHAGQTTVRSLDWIEERYPGIPIEPESPYELMEWHPILGDWQTLLGWYSQQADAGIYDNHCRLIELHLEKCAKYPEGRSIIWAGDVLLADQPMYRTVEGQSCPTVKYAAARFKPIHRSFWGRGLVDDLISPQNRLNGIDSQMIEARERMGSPNIMFSENMDVTGPEWFEMYGAGKFLRYQTDPLNPSARPEVFGSILMPAEVYQERDRTVQDMKEIAGPQDVEQGEAPRNVGTTSGLQLLYERADSLRGPRERALVTMYQKVWEHQLEMLSVLRVEPEDYEVETADGSWEIRQFDRTTLAGQTKLKVEKQAEVEKSVYQREATREAQADGLYRLDSQQAIKKLLELRGLPTDVNPDLNQQVDLGKRQYVDFVDQGLVPTIDPSLDDFRIRFQVLATMLLEDEGQELQKSIGWPDLVKKIGGWELELQKAEMLDAQVRQIYSPMQTTEQNNQTYAMAMVNFNQQTKAFEQMGQAAAQMGQIGQAAAMPPPQAPPPPVFMPSDKADRVYMVWMQMITAGLQREQESQGMPVQPGQPPVTPEQDNFLKFRAVVEGYKLLAEAKEAMAMMPPMPSPGTPQGNPGMGGALPGLQASGTNPSPPQPPAGVPGPSVS